MCLSIYATRPHQPQESSYQPLPLTASCWKYPCASLVSDEKQHSRENTGLALGTIVVSTLQLLMVQKWLCCWWNSEVFTQTTFAVHGICIICRPLSWGLSPRGACTRGAGGINWYSPLLNIIFQSLFVLAARLPTCFALEGERSLQKSSQSPRVVIIFLIPLNWSVFSLACLPAAVKIQSICNPDFISCWARSFKIAWHEAK